MKQSGFIFLLMLSIEGYAQVSLQVEPSAITAEQSIRLILSTDSASQGEPDFSVLQTDFTIIGRDNSTSYSIINGQTSSTRQWLLVLMPKHTGTLTIPALTIGQEHTDATSIEVTQAAPADTSSSTDAAQEVMLKAQVNNKTPYINEEMIYTVKLYNSLQLLNPAYQAPVAADALIIPLGQSRSYQANEHGRTYSVEEQHYAIFPQKSGVLRISPPEFNALVYNGLASQVSIKAPLVPVKVRAAPVGGSWLPAKNVILHDAWDKTHSDLMQGSTLIRKITIEATGLPAQLLPALAVEGNDTFSVYADKPIENNKLRDNHLLGTRTITFTYLFNKSGNIVIPAIKLPWFNTTTGKQESVTLPETRFDIKAASPLSLESNTSIKPMLATKPALPSTEIALAWWVAGGFALAWLITVMLWWQPWRLFCKKGTAFYLKQLHAACMANDPECAKQALLQWATHQWPTDSVLNLASISQLVIDKELSQEINHLAAVLYRSGKHNWQGRLLWSYMAKFRLNSAVVSAKHNILPPINPSVASNRSER